MCVISILVWLRPCNTGYDPSQDKVTTYSTKSKRTKGFILNIMPLAKMLLPQKSIQE